MYFKGEKKTGGFESSNNNEPIPSPNYKFTDIRCDGDYKKKSRA
jgi:hypothetical protein